MIDHQGATKLFEMLRHHVDQFLNSIGQESNSSARQYLTDLLWDNKNGIVKVAEVASGIEDLRKVFCEVWGMDEKTWPTHNNVLLAMASMIIVKDRESKRMAELLRKARAVITIPDGQDVIREINEVLK